MSIKAIDYKIILKRDGQTQQQRMPQWLDPSLVPVDARTKEDFFNYIKAVAKEINFYDPDNYKVSDNKEPLPNGNWEEFFNFEAGELEDLAGKASLPPHIALWNTFIALYEKPKQLMNELTGRHLDFYYNTVLRLQKNAPVNDKVHVTFDLKKNTVPILLKAGTSLLAGKDAAKKDIHYKLAHDIVVNKSAVAGLKSLYINPLNKNAVYYAPVANSSDGLGGKPDKDNPKWNAFGNNTLPLAQVGFCLAAPVLKMQEGDRTVTVNLTISNLPEAALNNSLTANLFKVSLTGEKGWLGPKTVSLTASSYDKKIFNVQFSFLIAKEEPAVTAYTTAVHGYDFQTLNPVLLIIISNEKAGFGYRDLMGAELIDATIEVNVKGIKNLQLENDSGSLNPKKAFKPFGAVPEKNSNFSVAYEEAFAKRLKEFSFDVEWKNIPSENIGDYYKAFGTSANNDFKALAAFKDGYSWEEKSNEIAIFNTSNAQGGTTWKFTNPSFGLKYLVLNIPFVSVKAQVMTGQSVLQKVTGKMSYLIPAFASLQVANLTPQKVLYGPVLQNMLNAYKDVRKGMISFRLTRGFYAKEYPRKYTDEIVRYSKEGGTLQLPSEPFAPEMQSLLLNYTATTSKTSFNGVTLNDYIDEEIEFFHFGAFGQMREHAFTRSQVAFLNNTLVKLLPQYDNEGEFYIGFSGLNPEDSACVLFQAAEGSANPLKPKADLKWSVLCDNYWKELINEDFVFDTTNDFLTSGIIKFIIPGEATTTNTIMPGGLLWLKAAIQKDADAVCSLTGVKANAAIAEFNNQDNDPLHFATALAAGSISKLEQDAAAIKTVAQPYASFGGRGAEDDSAFYTRVSERLRHKERSIALWDYERLILQHFPQVYKVKCINHAAPGSFYSSGNVMIVVVPALTNQNAVNRFQPAVDKNTLDEITVFLKKYASGWAEPFVSNPYYEPVKISVGIKLKTGFEFNYYEKIIDEQLQAFLSPWINNAGSDIHFGGKITKSLIVKFLEGLEYVDFLTDLRLFQSTNNSAGFGNDTDIAEASNPAAILVSHVHHEIFNY